MKVLVIGSGGREHALTWKLKQSPIVSRVIVAPGNPGIAAEADCQRIASDDLDGIVSFSTQSGIDLVVVGPEAPLASGLADRLISNGISVFGPVKAAAQLESSKVFAKEFCRRHRIPTAPFSVCENAGQVMAAAASRDHSCVIKADGLAAGKGVFVCRNREDVQAAVRDLFNADLFGKAASRVIVENLLTGEEVSILAVSDGHRFVMLEPSQDHKAAYDHDQGPNTGGMGAYSPAPVITPDLMETISNTIIRPVIEGMNADGTPFRGILYAGLMIDRGEPMVLEFNVRFGDPETQPLMMRLRSDLAELLGAAAAGDLRDWTGLDWSTDPAVCVVLASGGYPGAYQKNKEILGLEEAEKITDVKIFHAGTAMNPSGRLVTGGGRVLGVTASGNTLRKACESAYSAVERIRFDGCFYRKDIGYRALARNE